MIHLEFKAHKAMPPFTQGEHLMFLDHNTLALSLHGQCSTYNNADDDKNVVFTLQLNINPLAFYNDTISLFLTSINS